MAIIKNNKSNMQIHAVFEDPRPSGNRIFIWSEAFKKDTLDYVIAGGMNHNTAKNSLASWGYPSLSYGTEIRWTGVLLLSGETVHCLHVATGNNDRANTLDMSMFLSMDPDKPVRNHRHIVNGADSAVLSLYNHFQYNNANPGSVWEIYYNPGSTELDNASISQSSTFAFRQMWCLDYDTANNYMLCLTHWSDSTARAWPASWGPGRIRNILSSSGFAIDSPTQYGAVFLQFLGLATTGDPLFLNNSVDNDHTQLLIRYNRTSNTNTVLQTINTIPSAAGTSAGGNRGTTFGNTNSKVSSKIFDDPSSAGNKAWYTPYLDVNGRYHPHFFQWNKAADVFIRNTDITVNWGAIQQSDVWLPDTISAASSSQTFQFQRPWYNETFTVAGTRYLTFMQFHGSGTVYDSEPKYRTFVTFTVNASNPKTLDYHSHVVIPYTPKNIIWLNDARTLMGIFGTSNFNIYSFNQTNGWTVTTSLPFRFDSAGRDSYGRIWAVEGGPFTFGRLHIITPAVPTTVTVQLSESQYNYSGTTIETTATVDAFDVSGNRLIADITLNVEGDSLKFLNTSSQQVSSLVVTTNTATSTPVDVRIISSGLSYIKTSVNI